MKIVRSSISQQIRLRAENSEEHVIRQIPPEISFISIFGWSKTATAAKDAIAERAVLRTEKSAEGAFVATPGFAWTSRFQVDNGEEREMLRDGSTVKSRIYFPMLP